MGLFGRKDWNVIAIIYERKDLYTVNGNRSKGSAAEQVRDGVKKHARVIHYAVFDQKGKMLEDAPGKNYLALAPETYEKLKKDLMRNHTVREVLGMLEAGTSDKIAKKMIWSGYPLPDKHED